LNKDGAEQTRSAFKPYAAELTNTAPDVILANTTPAVAALQRATYSIPTSVIWRRSNERLVCSRAILMAD